MRDRNGKTHGQASAFSSAVPDGFGNCAFDTLAVLAADICFGVEMVGPERMRYSSDHPRVSPQLNIENTRSLNLSAKVEQRIFRDNARNLFYL